MCCRILLMVDDLLVYINVLRGCKVHFLDTGNLFRSILTFLVNIVSWLKELSIVVNIQDHLNHIIAFSVLIPWNRTLTLIHVSAFFICT